MAVVNPRAYLHEYYYTLGAENRALLAFLVRSFAGRGQADRPVVLDFGCGPTLYTAIVAAPHAREIRPGETIVREGDSGDRLFVIARGTLE